MPIATNEMLDAVDQAIKDSPWWIPGAPVLDLTGSRVVLGQAGKRVNERDLDPDDPWTYSFTRHQCKKMRRTIRRAARHDAKRR
jgi:hypothetical protein